MPISWGPHLPTSSTASRTQSMSGSIGSYTQTEANTGMPLSLSLVGTRGPSPPALISSDNILTSESSDQDDTSSTVSSTSSRMETTTSAIEELFRTPTTLRRQNAILGERPSTTVPVSLNSWRPSSTPPPRNTSSDTSTYLRSRTTGSTPRPATSRSSNETPLLSLRQLTSGLLMCLER